MNLNHFLPFLGSKEEARKWLQGLEMFDDSRETILGRTERLPLWTKAVVTTSTRLQQSQTRQNFSTERRGAIPRWEAVGN